MDNESRGGEGGYTCRKCGFCNQSAAAEKNNASTSNVSHAKRPATSSNRKQPPNAPKGLDEFLLNFTVSIIEQQPNDLEQFAYDYFNNIRLKKTNRGYMNSGGTVSAVGGGVISSSGNSNSNSSNNNRSSNGGIPTIVMSAAVETPTNEEGGITNEFENMRLSNMSRAQGRRFSVFNKAFDPESSSQDSEGSVDGGGTKIYIGSSSSYHNANDHSNGNSSGVGVGGGGVESTTSLEELTSGYEENIETTQNRLFEERHIALKQTISDPDQEKIKSTLSSIVLFKQMFDTQDELEQRQIIGSMFERVCRRDEVVISQGDEGNYFYVIMRGAFDVYVKSSGAPEDQLYGKRVVQLKDKGYFGELALLYNQPRSATIICVEDGSRLYCLNRKNFQELMIKNSFKRRQNYKVLLKSVPLLRDALGEAEISKVADALSTKVFKPGELIFHQNDEPNGIYFVESGQVNIIQEASNQNSQRFLLRRLKLGEYFGEVALINKSPRSASAYADEVSRDTCRVAFLDLNAFERLLGPCVELFKSKMVDYKNI